jgi:hypothetical protein
MNKEISLKRVAKLGYGLTIKKDDLGYYLILNNDNKNVIVLNGPWLDWAKNEERWEEPGTW